jgi:hypothetical protein
MKEPTTNHQREHQRQASNQPGCGTNHQTYKQVSRTQTNRPTTELNKRGQPPFFAMSNRYNGNKRTETRFCTKWENVTCGAVV